MLGGQIVRFRVKCLFGKKYTIVHLWCIWSGYTIIWYRFLRNTQTDTPISGWIHQVAFYLGFWVWKCKCKPTFYQVFIPNPLNILIAPSLVFCPIIQVCTYTLRQQHGITKTGPENILMVNCWFGARWFGIRIGVPLRNNPFSRIPGIQTTGPQTNGPQIIRMFPPPQKKTSWWWFQPIWKICSSNWIISPGFGVKRNFFWNHPD